MTEERFEISCPGCNQQYEVDDTRLGTELDCHGCGETFLISDEMLQTVDADPPDEAQREKVEDDSEPITENKKSKKTRRSWVLNTGVALCIVVQCVILFYVKEHNEMNAEIGNKITNLEIKLSSVSLDVDLIRMNNSFRQPEVMQPVDRFRVTTEDIASQLRSVESELSILSRDMSSIETTINFEINRKLSAIERDLSSIEIDMGWIKLR